MNRWQQLAAVAVQWTALALLAWSQPRIILVATVFVALLVACLVYSIEAVVRAREQQSGTVYALRKDVAERQDYIDSRGDVWEAERAAFERRCTTAEHEVDELRIGVKHWHDLFDNEQNKVAALRRQIAALEGRIAALEGRIRELEDRANEGA